MSDLLANHGPTRHRSRHAKGSVPLSSIVRLRSTTAAVVLQGAWRRTSHRPTVEVPYVNSVCIECDRTARICNEYVAKFIQKTDDPLGAVERPYLFLMKEQFRVIECTGTTIAARAEPRAADIDLRISLTNRMAERSSRETAARGAQGANPQNVTQWVLQ
jgi:hypothetical protein